MALSDFEVIIGLEVHARMNTQTKLFSRADNIALPELPNTTVTAFSMGYPGMLPVLNKEAVKLAVTASLALNCTVNEYCKFDRKNYFYPDLPLGYQISQFDEPLAEGGSLTVELEEGEKTIGITRLHVENDAGKLTHVEGGSLCDYNRAGAPLMEIVSEPDMRGVEDASMYVRELQKILRACGSSDCDMEKGMMRFDLNISLRKKGASEYGKRVEVKNLNSFRSLEKAIEYEMNRQAEILDEGGKIDQETRGWNDAREVTLSQRSKEEAADYRYFPEPDLPPLKLSKEYIEELRSTLPELPLARKKRYMEQFECDSDTARILSSDYALGDLFEALTEKTGNAKASLTWVTSILLKYLNDEQRSVVDMPVTMEHIADIIMRVDNNELSNLQAKEVFEDMYFTKRSPQEIIDEKGFKQVSNEDELRPLCEKILTDNASQVEAYRSGKDKLFGFFVGQVMKETKGQANPNVVNDLLKKLLDEA